VLSHAASVPHRHTTGAEDATVRAVTRHKLSRGSAAGRESLRLSDLSVGRPVVLSRVV